VAARQAAIVHFGGFFAADSYFGVSSFVKPVVHFWRLVTLALGAVSIAKAARRLPIAKEQQDPFSMAELKTY
jgi:hypothetical protein